MEAKIIHVTRQQRDNNTQHRTSHLDTTPGMMTPGAPKPQIHPVSALHAAIHTTLTRLSPWLPLSLPLTPPSISAKNSRPFALPGSCHLPLSLLCGRFSLRVKARGSLSRKGCTNLAIFLFVPRPHRQQKPQGSQRTHTALSRTVGSCSGRCDVG